MLELVDTRETHPRRRRERRWRGGAADRPASRAMELGGRKAPPEPARRHPVGGKARALRGRNTQRSPWLRSAWFGNCETRGSL